MAVGNDTTVGGASAINAGNTTTDVEAGNAGLLTGLQNGTAYDVSTLGTVDINNVGADAASLSALGYVANQVTSYEAQAVGQSQAAVGSVTGAVGEAIKNQSQTQTQQFTSLLVPLALIAALGIVSYYTLRS